MVECTIGDKVKTKSGVVGTVIRIDPKNGNVKIETSRGKTINMIPREIVAIVE